MGWIVSRRFALISLWLLLVILMIAPASHAEGLLEPRDLKAFDESVELPIQSDEAMFDLFDVHRPGVGRPMEEAIEARDVVRLKVVWRDHLKRRQTPRAVIGRDEHIQLANSIGEDGAARLFEMRDRILAGRYNLGGREEKLKPWDGTANSAFDWHDARIHPQSRQILNHLHEWVAVGRAHRSVVAADGAMPSGAIIGCWFDAQVKSWADANPMVEKQWLFERDDIRQPLKRFALAPGWHHYRSLCVGIRVSNLVEAMDLFVVSEGVSDEAIWTLTRLLIEHGRYLEMLLRVEGYRAGNWPIIEATGLLQLAIMLPEVKESRGWLATADRYLKEAVDRDVLEDGWQMERTPMYHGWVVSRLTAMYALAEMNGVALSLDRGRLERMFEVYVGMATPDGWMPGIGDARAGRVRSHATMGAVFTGRADLRWLGSPTLDETQLRTFGLGAIERYAELQGVMPNRREHRFEHAGYHVMRSGWDHRRDVWAMLDGATYAGGHSHADAGQVLLWAGSVSGGRFLLTDAGMCDYSLKQSVELRGQAFHNVVDVGGAMSARAEPQLFNITRRKNNGDEETDGAKEGDGPTDAAVGGVRIRHALGPGRVATHRRVVVLVPPGVGGDKCDVRMFVVDVIDGPREVELTRRFGLSPGQALLDAGSLTTRWPSGANLDLRFSDSIEHAELLTQSIPRDAHAFADRSMLELRSRLGESFSESEVPRDDANEAHVGAGRSDVRWTVMGVVEAPETRGRFTVEQRGFAPDDPMGLVQLSIRSTGEDRSELLRLTVRGDSKGLEVTMISNDPSQKVAGVIRTDRWSVR